MNVASAMRRLGVGLLTGLALLALVTYVALESSGVALLDTTAPSGETRTTHVWYVDANGTRWLEAGTPRNPWYTDVLDRPELRLHVAENTSVFVAEPDREPEPGVDGHEWIRARMREKYGWRDRWVSLLFDTTQSIAVRLAAKPSPAPAPN